MMLMNHSCWKYFGIVIDEGLTLDSHITQACSKVCIRTKLLLRICGFINEDLIYIHFVYANCVLDGANKTGEDKSRIQQKDTIRAVLKVDYCLLTMRPFAERNRYTLEKNIKTVIVKIVYEGISNI